MTRHGDNRMKAPSLNRKWYRRRASQSSWRGQSDREVRLGCLELPILLTGGLAGAGTPAAAQDGVRILSNPYALNELAQAVAEVSSVGTDLR